MKDKYYCARIEEMVDPDKCKQNIGIKDVNLHENGFDSIIEDLTLFYESPDTNKYQYNSFLDLWNDFVKYQHGD